MAKSLTSFVVPERLHSGRNMLVHCPYEELIESRGHLNLEYVESGLQAKTKDISYGLDKCHSLSQPLSPSGMHWVVTRRRHMQLMHTCSACDLGFFFFMCISICIEKCISWLITLQTSICITNIIISSTYMYV